MGGRGGQGAGGDKLVPGLGLEVASVSLAKKRAKRVVGRDLIVVKGSESRDERLGVSDTILFNPSPTGLLSPGRK